MTCPNMSLLVVLLHHDHVDKTFLTPSTGKLSAISNFSFQNSRCVQFQIFRLHFLLFPGQLFQVQHLAVAVDLLHGLEGLAIGREKK